MFSWGLKIVKFFIEVIILGLQHARRHCKRIVFPYFPSTLINAFSLGKFKNEVN